MKGQSTMAKKKRSAKQKANDKRLGAMAKKRAKGGRKTSKKRSKRSVKKGTILETLRNVTVVIKK
jgi:hypothetical protein